jgi:hypothetical protein
MPSTCAKYAGSRQARKRFGFGTTLNRLEFRPILPFNIVLREIQVVLDVTDHELKVEGVDRFIQQTTKIDIRHVSGT